MQEKKQIQNEKQENRRSFLRSFTKGALAAGITIMGFNLPRKTIAVEEDKRDFELMDGYEPCECGCTCDCGCDCNCSCGCECGNCNCICGCSCPDHGPGEAASTEATGGAVSAPTNSGLNSYYSGIGHCNYTEAGSESGSSGASGWGSTPGFEAGDAVNYAPVVSHWSQY